jgi:WD40 repeat protein
MGMESEEMQRLLYEKILLDDSRTLSSLPGADNAEELQLSLVIVKSMFVATASEDNTAKIWCAYTGRCLQTLSHTDSLLMVMFSLDGDLAVTASYDRMASIWRVSSGQLEWNLVGHTNWVVDAQFSPDVTKVATCSRDETCRLWSTSTGACLHVLRSHAGLVTSCVFSPNSEYLLTTSYDRRARLWNATNGRCVRDPLGNTQAIFGTFTPDGSRFLATFLDGSAYSWSTEGETEATAFRGHTALTYKAQFSPDGLQVATASADRKGKLWDPFTGTCLHTLTHRGEVICVAYSTSGTCVVTASDDRTAMIWSTAGEALHTLSGHTEALTSVMFLPDTSQVVTSSKDRSAKIWNGETGELCFDLVGHTHSVWHADAILGKR